MPPFGLVPTLALIAWIPFSIIAFSLLRSERAVLFVMFGGVMFLPELAEFDFPAIPPLGKMEISGLCALAGIAFRRPGTIVKSKPFRSIEFCVLALMLAAIGTALYNDDPLTYGGWRKTHLPALTPRDAVSLAIRDFTTIGVPFFVGRVLYKRARDLRDIMGFLTSAGLIYSFFILVEVRMSPQFHNWVYGYGQHLDFLQAIRWGGYRPMVFMAHGLAVGIFMAISVISAGFLVKAKRRALLVSSRWALGYLCVILVLCKSAGALVYAAVLLPVVLIAKAKTIMRLAIVLSALVILYPALRATDVFPTDKLVSASLNFSASRAQSLKFRFDNEDALVKKAGERKWFGWGGFGRRSIYDKEIGKEISIADGHWIIQYGQRGLFGFIPLFGLLLCPVWLAFRRLKYLRAGSERTLLSGFALIVTVYTVDLLPNGLFSTLPFFLSGALWGVTKGLTEASVRPRTHAGEPTRPSVPPPADSAAA